MGTARRELRADHADPIRIADYVAQSVDWISRVLEERGRPLPLIDRERRIARPCPPTSSYPILLDGVRWARPGEEVARIAKWTGGRAGGRFPPATDPVVVWDPPPAWRWVESDDLGPDRRLLHPPAEGWPGDATWLEVTVWEGLLPNEHPALRAAVVNAVRWLWMGKTDGDVLALVEGLMAVYVRDGFLSVRTRGRERG